MLEQKIKQLEDDYVKNNSLNLFKTIRELEVKPEKSVNIVLDKDRNKEANISELPKIWKSILKNR